MPRHGAMSHAKTPYKYRVGVTIDPPTYYLLVHHPHTDCIESTRWSLLWCRNLLVKYKNVGDMYAALETEILGEHAARLLLQYCVMVRSSNDRSASVNVEWLHQENQTGGITRHVDLLMKCAVNGQWLHQENRTCGNTSHVDLLMRCSFATAWGMEAQLVKVVVPCRYYPSRG